MNSEKKILAYTVAFDHSGFGGSRQMAHMLASSISRAYLNGELFIIRNSEDPIFQIERKGVEEIYVPTPDLNDDDQRLADLANAWKFRSRVQLTEDLVSNYDVVMFIDADCLVLRNMDHLFAGDDWDILYQTEPGRMISDPVFRAYLTEEEKRSSRFGINAGTWATRAEIFHEVTGVWESLMRKTPKGDSRWRDQAAWNRLILDSKDYGWRAKPFESYEIQFPLHLNLDWKHYQNAALVHCVGGDTLEKLKFMFGMYMQTYFHDSHNTVISLLDM